MNKYIVLSFALLVSLLIGCGEKHPLQKVDISNIELSLEIKRMEQDIFLQKDSLPNHISQLKEDYQNIFTLYATHIMQLGKPTDSLFPFRFIRFINDPNLLTIKDSVDQLYPDFSKYEKELEQAFRYYQHYFPEKEIPQIYTTLTGFNYNIIVAENSLGIGLDMYMGKNFKDYLHMGIPQYKVQLMSADYIVRDAIYSWMLSETSEATLHSDLISRMIYKGKLMYALDAMLPFAKDSVKIGYSTKEINYCKENEAKLWAFFIENEMLYMTNAKEISRYTEEGPFTSTISKESPARIGEWFGWQIVKAYMKKHPNTSLSQLLNEKDMHRFFVQSGYKPRR